MMKFDFPIQRISVLRFFIFIMLGILTFSSCRKEEIDSEVTGNAGNNSNNDNYYVNYVIQAPGPYGRFSNWTATTPDGTFRNSGLQIARWNQTFGPVQKGFNCKVQIANYQGGTPTIEILVAKNGEPFALKTSVTGASASYVINF